MKFVVVAFLSLVAPVALAFNPVSVEPEQPYQPILVTDEAFVEQEFLGTLEGYPEMYEITTGVSVDLIVKLQQRGDKAQPLNLIVVRDNDDDGGVVEVARLNQPTAEWQEVKNRTVAATFIQSRVLNLSVPPGTYRIEVSTPDNIGDYMLIIGDDPTSVGYFTTLGNIFETQRHFGFNFFRFFLSPFVYIPLGILLIGVGLYFHYRPPRYSKYGT